MKEGIKWDAEESRLKALLQRAKLERSSTSETMTIEVYFRLGKIKFVVYSEFVIFIISGSNKKTAVQKHVVHWLSGYVTFHFSVLSASLCLTWSLSRPHD